MKKKIFYLMIIIPLMVLTLNIRKSKAATNGDRLNDVFITITYTDNYYVRFIMYSLDSDIGTTSEWYEPVASEYYWLIDLMANENKTLNDALHKTFYAPYMIYNSYNDFWGVDSIQNLQYIILNQDNPDRYFDGYNDGYDQGHEDGYNNAKDYYISYFNQQILNLETQIQNMYGIGHEDGFNVGFLAGKDLVLSEAFSGYELSIHIWTNPETYEIYMYSFDFSNINSFQDLDNEINNYTRYVFEAANARVQWERDSQDSLAYDNWLVNIFLGMGAILGIQIAPNITLGMFVFVPMAFGLLFWFLKLMKGGGD